MDGPRTDVSIIMPTMGRPERAPGLLRAIDSVTSQQGPRGIPLVVVNGSGGAPDLLAHLGRRRDIRLITREEPNLPRALLAGRKLVDTPYFGVLDDDDQLLPGALQTRLDVVETAPGADVVVTNGFFEREGHRELNIGDFARIEADPLRMLLVQHWLPPCAGFFRTASVSEEFFEAIPQYREWTFLALRFALALKIAFAARPTFVYCFDTPGSLSKSRAYCLGGPAAIMRMLELGLPADVRATLRVRLASDLHSASSTELADGNCGAAWRWHWRSLIQPSGWRYLPYVRNLVLASLFYQAAGRRRRTARPT